MHLALHDFLVQTVIRSFTMIKNIYISISQSSINSNEAMQPLLNVLKLATHLVLNEFLVQTVVRSFIMIKKNYTSISQLKKYVDCNSACRYDVYLDFGSVRRCARCMQLFCL